MDIFGIHVPGITDNTVIEGATAKLVEISITIAVWHFRNFIIHPVQFVIRYVFSDRFKNLRRIGGDYYLYHPPLMFAIGSDHISPGSRIRVTKLKLSIGLRRSRAVQTECKGSPEVGYEGGIEIKREFFFIHAKGVMSRYAGNEKFIVLYRQQYAAKTVPHPRLPLIKVSAVNMGTCGVMVGISHDNNIYRVPVVISKVPLRYAEADQLLKLLDQKGVTTSSAFTVQRYLEGVPLDQPEDLEEFTTPFV